MITSSTIFISHSKRDRELVGRIKTVLENIGHNPLIEEYIPAENKLPVPYQEIRQKIEVADFVFLFLTDNVVMTEYTRNWVMFEVSLALGSNRRLFVFEREGSPVPYPVPYLTDYMIFSSGIDDMLEIQSIAKSAGWSSPPTGLIGAGLGALIGLPFGPLGLILGALGGGAFGAASQSQNQIQAQIPKITCPHCGVSYNYYSLRIRSFACPSCRQWIELAEK